MSDDTKLTTIANTVDIESSTEEATKITVKNISYNGVVYTSEWTTDGLKVPIVVSSKPFFLLIPREEVIKMFKDIIEELSHT